jgi:ATP-dependent RNA helicase MSS116
MLRRLLPRHASARLWSTRVVSSTVLPLNCRSGRILQRSCIAGQRLYVVSARSVRLFSVDTLSDNGAPDDVSSDEDAVSTGDAERTVMLFKDLQGLDPRILSAIDKLGLSEMTEIQAKSYGPAAEGKDVLGRAQTGTGKTFAFLVPTIQRILQQQRDFIDDDDYTNERIQVLILSPTRELALQIDSQVQALHMDSIYHQTLFGGVPKYHDINLLLDRLPNILVATPGRLCDHIRNTRIDGDSFHKLLSKIDILILDEADRYIDMGSDIPMILSALPKKRQTLLFSATLPPHVQSFLRKSMKTSFEQIDCVSVGTQTSQVVDQSYVLLNSERNLMSGIVEVIRHYMDTCPNAKIIVFFPTTSMVAFFAKIFNFGLGGKYVLEIHSKKTQTYRTSVSKRFRELKKGVLFSSDVSARGVDYPGITHVIQIGLPSSQESYIHRLGRTGRAGNTGEGILVLTEMEEGFMETLEDGISVPVNEELQAIVDSPKSSKVKRELGPVLNSIQTESNEALLKAAEETYRSIIGYYSGKLSKVGVKGLPKLVDFCNAFAKQIGCPRTPAINAKTAQTLGLHKIPGIVLEMRNERGSRGNKKPAARRLDDAIAGRGDYDSWGSAAAAPASPKRRRASSRGKSGASNKSKPAWQSWFD